MDHKNAIVTGALGAIGKAIARQIASMHEYSVTIVVRDEERAKQAVEELKQDTGNRDIDYRIADLSREAQIKAISEDWNKPLHVLVNNASATPRQRMETPEGIEMQWATNVLGYAWMIRYFENSLDKAGSARIVNVASYWAGGLDFSDLEFKNRYYNNDTAYRQSKQADRMLTVGFAERLKEKGITVNAVHPGDVNSKLSNNLGYGGHETPDQGADTPVWAATSPELEGVTGKYFESRQLQMCRFGEDGESVERLMRVI
jgi:NAD(P)-dependent dehydrogenase (short-subunit alcohol dehydrogenase family)